MTLMRCSSEGAPLLFSPRQAHQCRLSIFAIKLDQRERFIAFASTASRGRDLAQLLLNVAMLEDALNVPDVCGFEVKSRKGFAQKVKVQIFYAGQRL